MSVRGIISVSHLVYCELCIADDKPRVLDLSIFGTPAGVSDENIIEGWSVENLTYTDVSIVTELGGYRTIITEFDCHTQPKGMLHVYTCEGGQVISGALCDIRQ